MSGDVVMIAGVATTLTESQGNFKVRFRHGGQVYDWTKLETLEEARAAQWFLTGMRPPETYPRDKFDHRWYGVDPFAEILPILAPDGPKKQPASKTDANQVRSREPRRGPYQRRPHRPISH